MADINTPALGESVTEATVARWTKKVGEAVKKDEILVELETDKVTVEVPAPAAGTLDEIVAKEGETVGVDALLATIVEAGAKSAPEKAEKKAKRKAEKAAAEKEEATETKVNISAVVGTDAKATDVIVCSTTGRERVIGCFECGITQTPQWRQGQHGPKTLCNRCGVAYRKRQLLNSSALF